MVGTMRKIVVVVFCAIGCMNRAEHGATVRRAKGQEGTMNIALVEDCIRQFIKAKRSHPELAEFSMDQGTLVGDRREIMKGAWILGGWSITCESGGCIARLSERAGWRSVHSVCLDIAWDGKAGRYMVAKWGVEEATTGKEGNRVSPSRQ